MAISLKDVWFKYPQSSNWAIRGINLNVNTGESACITGPSGCGKTTLCMCLNGLIPHHIPGELRGNTTLDKWNIKKSSIAELSQRVGLVFQNPESQLFLLRIIDEVAFGPENLCVPPNEILERVERALEDVGMLGKEEENPTEISGGQKQRVAIASVLSMKPNILVLDEPLTQLDHGGKTRLLEVLKKLKSEGISIIITEHNITPLLYLVDKLIVMNDGEIILVKYVKDLSLEDIDKIKRIGVRWHLKRRDNKKSRARCRCPGGFRVFVENASYTYPNGAEALKDASLKVKRGEFLGLVGENGSGKSTLLKCIMGFLKPKHGKIVVTGIENPTPEDLFGRVGFIFQNPDCQLFEENVFSEIAFSLRKMGLRENEIEKRVSWALEAVDMNGYELKNPLTLSMGQRHRVALASILVMKPRVILLDEPMHGLDIKNAERILDIIKSMQENLETTIVMASHDREVLEIYADRIVEMVGSHIEEPI